MYGRRLLLISNVNFGQYQSALWAAAGPNTRNAMNCYMALLIDESDQM